MVILILVDFLAEGLLTGQVARVYPTVSWSKTDDSQTCFEHFQAWPAPTVSGTAEWKRLPQSNNYHYFVLWPKTEDYKADNTAMQADLTFNLCNKEQEGLLTFNSDVKTDSKS